MIVRGAEVPVPGVTLKTWHETGLGFPALATRSETRAVVLHWTGGEGSGPGVHSVLEQRGLSVQFTVDQAGVVWQYCDASARAAHAGTANSWTVGIEISNRANGRAALTPGGKWAREVYEERVHGKRFKCCAFYPAQVAAVEALTRALCRSYGLPYAAPAEDTVLKPAVLAGYRGVLGHFHLTTRKVDPGTRLFSELGLR